MSDEPRRLTLAFTWRYDHSLGGLSRYFDGLAAGRAFATQCPRCGLTWFPPRLFCPEHGEAIGWTLLSGAGTIAGATLTRIALPLTGRTVDAWVALIAMDGADNRAIGRLDSGVAVSAGLRVRLAAEPADTAHPAQAAYFVPLRA